MDEPPLTKIYIDLVTRLRPTMVKRASRRLGEDAEDVVQDALARAWRYWPPQHLAQLDHWLLQVLNSRIAQYHRERRYMRRIPPAPLRQEWSRPPIGRRRELAQTLEEIPRPYRRTMELHALGYTIKEQAALEQCPIGTVLSRLHRARRLLAG